jgi:hypothetical protein
VKFRPTRSSGFGALESLIVVRLTFPRTARPGRARPSTAPPCSAGSAGHRRALAVQRQPHLPRAVDAVVRSVHRRDLRLQFSISHLASGWHWLASMFDLSLGLQYVGRTRAFGVGPDDGIEPAFPAWA